VNENIEMLNYVYQNAEMGKTTIEQILKEVNFLEFRDVLKEQLRDYQYVVNKCDTILSEEGKLPKGVDVMPKIMSYFKIKFDTLKDDTPSHIAEMMINGSTMGITDITKNLNRYNNINNETKDLASRLLKIEQDNIDVLKSYL
jgi:predicted methyltransferase